MSPEDGLKSDPPCHPQACAIQACLGKNSYQEDKCQDQINALYACCSSFYEKSGEDAQTVSCPKPSLLKLKMRQREEDGQSTGGS